MWLHHQIMVAHDLSTMNMAQQITLMMSTKVLIAEVGGASLISLFLPRHASLILIYNESRGPLDFSVHMNLPHVQTFMIRDEDAKRNTIIANTALNALRLYDGWE